MKATEIERAERTTLRTRPVFIRGIMQRQLLELTAPADAAVNGVALRLPAGCVIQVGGGGDGVLVGCLMTELTFEGRDGRTYRTSQGMQLRIVTA